MPPHKAAPNPLLLVPFILKVSPQNNGSEHLVLITEDPPPGGSIPKHKHLGQDEILLIQTGTVDVWLGDEERDLWNSRYAHTFNRIDKFFGVTTISTMP